VGREQLRRLPQIVRQRRALADGYRELLQSRQEPGLPVEPECARSNWQSYCVRLPERADQRGVMQSMLDAGISTRRGIMCSHREPAYRDFPPTSSLRHSERAQDHCLLLPLFPGMTRDEQEQVASTLIKACDRR